MKQVLNHTNFDICVFRVSYYPTSLWLRVLAGPYPEIISYIIVFDWSEAVHCMSDRLFMDVCDYDCINFSLLQKRQVCDV